MTQNKNALEDELRKALIDHTLSLLTFDDDDNCQYPLIDALTCEGRPITDGEQEIDYMLNMAIMPIVAPVMEELQALQEREERSDEATQAVDVADYKIRQIINEAKSGVIRKQDLNIVIWALEKSLQESKVKNLEGLKKDIINYLGLKNYETDKIHADHVITVCETIDHLAAQGMIGAVWQDISTAPKDGTDILAIGKVGDKWSARHILYFEECENRGWLCSRKHEPVSHLPTHWIPLPTPPKTSEE